jgi:iron complex transport system permease protein
MADMQSAEYIAPGLPPPDSSIIPISFSNRGKMAAIALSLLLLFISGIMSICIGAYSIPVGSVFKTILAKIQLSSVSGVEGTVIIDIRATRIFLAVAVGVSLATGGVVYQGIFRNPLVEPFILGVSTGSAFGAALAIMFPFPLSVQLSAFIFGLLAVSMTYFLSKTHGQTPLITLILCGIVISALFSALVSIFQYTGTEEQLKKLVFWLMGGLYRATWSNVYAAVPITCLGFFVVLYNSWSLNVISMGEEEAKTLGIHIERTKIILIVASTCLTSVAVSMAGIIGWIGLMIPHAARMLIGPDHRFLLPLAAIMGAIFMIVSDTLARVLSTGEIPIGIVTSILGAPYLLYLVRKKTNYIQG